MANDVRRAPRPTTVAEQARADVSAAAGGSGERQAGRSQLVLLLAASCMAVLGAVVISPVLPQMTDAFRGTAGYRVLVPIVLTVPALMIGLAAPFAGVIVDRLDRKRALVIAMVVYSVFGTMPLYLHSLYLIVASRVGVGLCEAAIMTSATTLIADYWDGPRRARYLSMQTLVAALSAVVFTGIGGALGANGWRTPFWLYVIAIPLAVLLARSIYNPLRTQAAGRRAELVPIPWRSLAAPLVVTLFGGVIFYALIVHLSFVLNDAGVTSTAKVGLVIAAMSLMNALGSVVFAVSLRRGTRILLPLALGLSGLGLLVIALTGTPGPIIVGSLLTGLGTGLLLPTLLTWAVSQLSFEARGRGTGLFIGSLFIGEFFCPLIVAGLAGAFGGRLVALGVLAVASVVAAVLAAVLLRRAGAATEVVADVQA